jgi:hypothetical protein
MTTAPTVDTLDFSYDRGIAQVSIDKPPVRIVFDQIHAERRTGDVTSEVLVYSGVNGSSALVSRSRLNLTSTRSREEIAKQLTGRLSGLNWSVLLERTSWKVVDPHRMGRPAILLRDAKPPPGGTVLMRTPSGGTLLLAKDRALGFGDGGNAKSLLGLAFGLSIHTGRPLVAGIKPTTTLRTALLDFEWNEIPHERRMRLLWGAGELPDLVYVACDAEGPLTHQVDRLRSIFNAYRIEYAIVDSVALACDGKPEDADVALRFFQALAQLEVGSFSLAHINRIGDEDKPFGSVFWHNSARATWFIKKVQEVGGKSLDLGLYQRKLNDGPLSAPFGLHLDFSADRTVISHTDLTAVPDLAARLTAKQRIIPTLFGGALTFEEIAEKTGIPEGTIRKTVDRSIGNPFTIITGDDGLQRVGLGARQ